MYPQSEINCAVWIRIYFIGPNPDGVYPYSCEHFIPPDVIWLAVPVFIGVPVSPVYLHCGVPISTTNAEIQEKPSDRHLTFKDDSSPSECVGQPVFRLRGWNNRPLRASAKRQILFGSLSYAAVRHDCDNSMSRLMPRTKNFSPGFHIICFGTKRHDNHIRRFIAP